MRRAWVGALSVALACNAVDSTQTSNAAPSNSCPDHACSAYSQPGAVPVCSGGFCQVLAQLSNLVLVVSLPGDSYFAPSRTYAIAFEHLFDAPATQGCAQPACAHLPGYGTVKGNYQVPPQVASLLNWNLGNSATTALPVLTTYRSLWGTPETDALALGLPLYPLLAQSFTNTNTGVVGPAGGPSIEFQTYLAPGPYERTVMPDPPFDQAFPPDVSQVQIVAGPPVFESDNLDNPDVTREMGTTSTFPTFDLTREDGLDGWTAYLRDTTTKRRISNVAQLGGTQSGTTEAKNVVLATNHHPANGDALSNAELVLAPPTGQLTPVAVFAPAGGVYLPSQETYPPLPAAATVRGSVAATDGTRVAADLVFEQLSVLLADGTSNDTNFEYVGLSSTEPDPSTGAAVYSITLPRGQYRVSVRPRDPRDVSNATTTFEPFGVLLQDPAIIGRNLVVAPSTIAQGVAQLTDGRPLAQATVEALPTQCPVPPTGDGEAPRSARTSTWCLPRTPQPVTTASDGSFSLSLDPGGYVLRVRPADGSRLPWVTQSLQVPSTVSAAPLVLPGPLMVPAPVFAGMQLLDAADPGNPVVNALVQVYTAPDAGQAVEVGHAITDTAGRYDMYLAPPTQ